MSIDSCYETVIGRLTSEEKIVSISKKFLSLETNAHKVIFVHEILKSLEVMPKIEQVNKGCVSIHYRNLGNQCFQKAQYYSAWQYYNLSLLHAPINSDAYTTALSNRTAVFCFLKKYEESLKDIDLIFTLGCPENLKEKLTKRKSLCQASLSKKEIIKDSKMSFEIEKVLNMQCEPDDRYTCASNKLQIVYTEEMGRHIIAKEDIRVGEVLAQEDPYFALLLKSQYLFSCSYCLSRKENLLPCGSCCFAMYCSKQCQDGAWKDYHEIECPLMPTLVKLEFTKLELLALRTVIKARRDHSDWTSLYKTIEEAESNVNSELQGCVKIDDKWVYDSKYYTSIHMLATNMDKRSVSDLFQKAVTAAVFLYLLENKTKFLDSNCDKEKVEIKKCVAGNLLLHSMTSPTNMHGLSSNLQTRDGNFVDEISLASAPYAFLSLLNHSCSPNVVRFSKLGNKQMTLFALRPIKKGMQLFDNYGSHHAVEGPGTRQASLHFQYKFKCTCEACEKNWPTYLFLSPAKNLPAKYRNIKANLLNPKAIEKLQKGDKSTALRLFKQLCELAEALEPYAPCVELADCQESMKQCLVIFEGVVPYEFGKIVDWPAIPNIKCSNP